MQNLSKYIHEYVRFTLEILIDGQYFNSRIMRNRIADHLPEIPAGDIDLQFEKELTKLAKKKLIWRSHVYRGQYFICNRRSDELCRPPLSPQIYVSVVEKIKK